MRVDVARRVLYIARSLRAGFTCCCVCRRRILISINIACLLLLYCTRRITPLRIEVKSHIQTHVHADVVLIERTQASTASRLALSSNKKFGRTWKLPLTHASIPTTPTYRYTSPDSMAPKRKRAGTASKEVLADTVPDTVQASSRDASGEDTADPVLEDVKERKSMDPPAKRSRATRSASNAKKPETPTTNGHQRRSSSSSAQMPVNALQEGGGENGEADGTMRMEAPPPAGAVDPVGYKTNPPPKDRPVRVYADGVFDLFHLGHMRVLQQAKTGFPDTWLIVGVTGDTETHKRKGLTVMSAKERAESLRHCRWVDEVIEDCPWIITVDFLEKHQIDYVAHDDLPYGANEGDDIYKPIKEKGMFLVTQRTEGVSTTGIITKIVRDYEQYVGRQLKRGTSRQELNVSWLKKNELDIKRHVSELRDTIRTNWTTTGQELSRDLKQFWTPSRPNSPAPSLRNGTPGGRNSTPGARGSGAKSPFADVAGGRNGDFAAGYAMGLIGGVKSWMEGSRRRNLSDSRAQSPDGDSEDSSNGEGEKMSRGRKGKSDEEEEGDVVVGEKMEVET